jgi:hypothetical protein
VNDPMRLKRRDVVLGGTAVALSATAGRAQRRRLFDSHCHIIDHRFPRATRPFEAADIDLIERVLGRELAQKAFWDNPLALYRVKAAAAG